MVKIAIAYSGDSKGLNGAALYVNRFVTIEDRLISVGIQPVICDYNRISNHADNDRKVVEVEKEYILSRTHALKNRIKRILSYTYIGNILYLQLAWKWPGKKAIALNKEKIEQSEAILANDIFSAYYSIKYFPDKSLVFVMHNSGELLNMLTSQLSHIKGKMTEKKLEIISKKIFSKSKKIVFVSYTAQKLFCKNNPEFAIKTVYIPVGIADVDYNPIRPVDPISFICVGTVCKRKNQISIVKAMKQVDATQATLTIVGNGEKLQECREFIRENNMNNVYCTGTVDSVAGYLNNASVFIIASLDEGLPAVGVEALRAGLPILTTDVGGCKELIQDNGFLIADATPTTILDSIKKIIKHKDKLQRMSEKSRKLYEQKYSIEMMVKAYKSVLIDDCKKKS